MGVFTTLRVRDGHAWFWEDHLRRLGDPPSDLLARVGRAVGDKPDARVRVTLTDDGDCVVEARTYAPPARPWTLRPVPVSPPADGPLLKTTKRDYYDAARAAAGRADDALLVAPSGAWLECTIANVFLVMGSGALLTPPAGLPLLPGIARANLMASTFVVEHEIFDYHARMASECFVTNALFVAHPVYEIKGVARFKGGELARRLLEFVPRRAVQARIIG